MGYESIVKINKSLEGIVESFKKNVVYKKKKFGTKEEHSFSCKKGNFSVYSSTKEEAEKEARHYFLQYFKDGEYN